MAIVGARQASEAGRRVARRLACDLAGAGVTVVSGGALGIDGEAHVGALEGGGATVVVLPTPVASPAPVRHLRLFEAILEAGGALVSEQLTPVRGKAPFQARNRIIAALGDVLILVEASGRSGTRHTIAAAEQLGRPVGVVPWPADHPLSVGGRSARQRGATTVHGLSCVLDLLQGTTPPPAPAADAGPVSCPVLKALALGPLVPQTISAQLGRPVQWVLAVLLRHEIEGLVRRHPGGMYVAV